MIRSSYSVLMRAKNDVVALRVTTMGNRGSKNQLPRALVAASTKRQVPGSAPKWRARRDSNSRPSDSKSDEQR